jgi:hypothetical protein
MTTRCSAGPAVPQLCGELRIVRANSCCSPELTSIIISFKLAWYDFQLHYSSSTLLSVDDMSPVIKQPLHVMHLSAQLGNYRSNTSHVYSSLISHRHRRTTFTFKCRMLSKAFMVEHLRPTLVMMLCSCSCTS